MSAPRGEPIRGARAIDTLYTQRQLADHFGVTVGAISNLENQALRKIRSAIRTEAAHAGTSVRAWLYGDE